MLYTFILIFLILAGFCNSFSAECINYLSVFVRTNNLATLNISNTYLEYLNPRRYQRTLNCTQKPLFIKRKGVLNSYHSDSSIVLLRIVITALEVVDYPR